MGGSRISPVIGEIQAIGIPTTIKIKRTVRYLSIHYLFYKTIYLFDYTEESRKTMIKILEITGLGLIAIMILGFVGALAPTIPIGASNPYFWGCAGGTLIIIVYRKRKRKQAEQK